VGHSPLIEVTKEQAKFLEGQLGDTYIVRAGMRHSEPFIDEAVCECKEQGASSLIGIILSPQFSSFIMEGYKTAFIAAAQAHGFDEKKIAVAEPWPAEPHFIELLAHRVTTSFAQLEKEYDIAVPVVFTTHSLPQRVVEKDPSYLQQLQATINAVLEKLNPTPEWYAGYQSAGHAPEEWLKPDLVDILDDLKQKKSPAVLIVPIQFLSDHLEVLYDLDIAARAQCEERTIAYHRIKLPNTDPLFINALEGIAHSTYQLTLAAPSALEGAFDILQK
jgi:ferrochelatase